MGQKPELLLSLPGKVTATSLELPKDLDYETWRVIGFRLAQFSQFANWALGDWLEQGERRWGEKYAQAATETGIKEERLMILKYVSSRIDPLLRNKNLPWTAHKEIAKLDPPQQKQWLSETAKNNWTIAQLIGELTKAGLRKDKAMKNGLKRISVSYFVNEKGEMTCDMCNKKEEFVVATVCGPCLMEFEEYRKSKTEPVKLKQGIEKMTNKAIDQIMGYYSTASVLPYYATPSPMPYITESKKK